jgi:phosphoserine phosphatase RsbU-like protein/GAF domain-containing protein
VSAAAAFDESYAFAVRRHLQEPGETLLRSAYELGRRAVAEGLSVLDLAVVHHEALRRILSDQAAAQDVDRALSGAEEVFLESLSAYEMVQRGFREAREAAAHERRQAAMLRRLSGFLADASLAGEASDSGREVLRLVAEQARELTDAETCVAILSGDGRSPIRVASHGDGAETGEGWSTLSAVGDGPASSVSGGPSRAALVASMTSLDGRRLGSIELRHREGRRFSELDEAVLLQLAEMASAAFERARLYFDART